jgi:hypothetical protein
MTTLGQKIGLVLITCAAFVLAGAPAKAATTAVHDASSDITATQSPQGVKGRTVAKAVVLVAKGIRAGNKHLGKIVVNLKGPAGVAFVQNMGKIADVLDDIAKIPDLVLNVVRVKLFHILQVNPGPFQIDPGLAKDITEEIVYVISGLL